MTTKDYKCIRDKKKSIRRVLWLLVAKLSSVKFGGKWNFKIKNVTKFQSNCTPAMVHILVRQLPVALFTQLLCSGPDPGTWIHSWSSKPSHARNSVSVWPAAWRCGSWKV